MIKLILCSYCKNKKISNKCKAFPNGIPTKIIIGEIDHKTPLEGQENKIVFEEE